MQTLEDLIRAAAANGRLDRLNFSQDRSGRGWQVSGRSQFGADGWAVEIDQDPVAALRKVLTPWGEPPARPSIDEMLS